MQNVVGKTTINQLQEILSNYPNKRELCRLVKKNLEKIEFWKKVFKWAKVNILF